MAAKHPINFLIVGPMNRVTPYDEKSLTEHLMTSLQSKPAEWFKEYSGSIHSTFQARLELLKQTTPNGFHSAYQHYRLMVDYLANSR